MSKARKNMVLFTVTVLVVIGLAEVFLRLFSPVDYMAIPRVRSSEPWRGLLHRPSPISGLNYELAPNMEIKTAKGFIETNSYGMRDTEPLPMNTKNLLRIACIGDSYTFGFKVPGHLTYCNALEKLLQEDLRNGNVDVLNFGVGGYSASDYALVTRHKAMKWNPDLIIVGYVLNDPETTPWQPLHRHFAPVQWWRHFHLTRLIAKSKENWDIKIRGDGDYVRYLHAKGYKKWQSVESAFRDIKSAAKVAKIPVILVIFAPFPSTNEQNVPHLEIIEQIVDAAESAGLETINLLENFAKHDRKDLKVTERDGHPSILAHRIVAEAIVEKLSRNYDHILKKYK